MKHTFLSMFAVGIVLVACTTTSDTDPAVADANVVNVAVGGSAGNQFSPAEVTVKPGQTVRWTFGTGSHNVQSGAECGKPDGTFSSGPPPSTGTYDKKFDAAGDFPYYCDNHCSMGMKGIVHVKP